MRIKIYKTIILSFLVVLMLVVVLASARDIKRDQTVIVGASEGDAAELIGQIKQSEGKLKTRLSELKIILAESKARVSSIMGKSIAAQKRIISATRSVLIQQLKKDSKMTFKDLRKLWSKCCGAGKLIGRSVLLLLWADLFVDAPFQDDTEYLNEKINYANSMCQWGPERLFEQTTAHLLLKSQHITTDGMDILFGGTAPLSGQMVLDTLIYLMEGGQIAGKPKAPDSTLCKDLFSMILADERIKKTILALSSDASLDLEQQNFYGETARKFFMEGATFLKVIKELRHKEKVTALTEARCLMKREFAEFVTLLNEAKTKLAEKRSLKDAINTELAKTDLPINERMALEREREAIEREIATLEMFLPMFEVVKDSAEKQINDALFGKDFLENPESVFDQSILDLYKGISHTYREAFLTPAGEWMYWEAPYAGAPSPFLAMAGRWYRIYTATSQFFVPPEKHVSTRDTGLLVFIEVKKDGSLPAFPDGKTDIFNFAEDGFQFLPQSTHPISWPTNEAKKIGELFPRVKYKRYNFIKTMETDIFIVAPGDIYPYSVHLYEDDECKSLEKPSISDCET